MEDIEMNLQPEEVGLDVNIDGTDSGTMSLDLSQDDGEILMTLEDGSENVSLNVEDQTEEVAMTIATAENAAQQAVEAKNRAMQAAEDAETYALQTRTAVNNINNNVGELENNLQGVRNRVSALESGAALHVAGGDVQDGVAYFYNEAGDELFTITGVGGGGGGQGGGDSATSVVTLTNTTGYASATVAENVDVILSFTWSSIEDGNPTGQGVMTVEIGGKVRESRNIAQGAFSVNVKNYVSRGDNKVVVRVTDGYGKNKWKQFNITVEQLQLESSFDESVPQTGALEFRFTPYGAFSKTIHFELDGTELEPLVTSISGREMNTIIRQQAHGAHTLRVWFTATINGETVTSNVLNYDIIWVTNGNNTPIISSSYSNNIIDQYSTITFPFMVYTPSSQVSTVLVKLDGVTIATLPDLSREMQSYQVRFDTDGNHVVRLQSGTAYKDIPLQVNAADMIIEAETENLQLFLTSNGRSNLEEHPETWQSTVGGNTVAATLTGFNYVSNGWIRDDENVTALRLNAGASVSIPFQPFANDFRQTGYTIEIEFAVRNVTDYTQTILSCMNGGRGFAFTSQSASLSSEQSSIAVQFKDDDHIRLSFVVNKSSSNRLLMCYINGIPSRVVQYPALDDFSQTTPAGITMNSSYGTLDIYNIRMYNNDLTGEQILNNWIADTQNGELMLQRYSRNNVYDAYGTIAMSKLPGTLPYMVIECPELPQYKGDKKTCTGRFVNPTDPTKSFEFTGCQINVQGTSSAVYARKNYDMQFKSGFEMSNGTHADKFQMVPTVKPFNRFVMKADVASSEGANNVELVKLYCDITPFKTREMKADPQVRPGIYGFPIVIFWTNTDTGNTTFLGKYNFNFPKRAPAPYGYSGDMESWEFQNNTSNLMLFKSDYFDETPKEDPTTGDVKATWLYDYEARFPDDTWTDYSKLQELQSFVYSTYRAEATGDALDEPVTYEDVTYTTDSVAYRLAKFRAEIGNYAEINSLIFYYVFTLFFLLADSRAKNLFIGFSGSDTDPEKVNVIDRKAVAEPYDMDTALGINNEGSLTFTYSLEDTDILGNGREVYTGQQSVLWNNLRDAFPAEIRQMYQTLRSGSIFNYSTIEQRFEDHQAIWPEAVWIEDSRFKYIFPLTRPDSGKEPTSAYLEMMLGSKLEQRRWWLSNRFKYMDSKFSAGDALSEVIQFRAYATSSLTITPYSDLYVTVKYGSYTGQQKTPQGTPVTIAVPIDNLSDTETYIYSATQIADVGDLSGFKLGWADFSHATRIQRIKIGDSAVNYENLPFERLTLGNNRLLNVIDCRNCVNLGTGEMKTVNMSGCTDIRQAYFDNTKITGVELPNGSPISVLHLPGTVTNLTLRNQTALTDFVCGTDAQHPDYTHITTLWLENPASCVDTNAIVNALPNGCRVRLYNFTWNLTDLTDVAAIFDKLDNMRGLDQNGNNTETAQVFGTIHVTTAVGSQIATIQARYPDVRILPEHVTSNVYYYSWDGNSLLATVGYVDGVAQSTYSGTPSRTSTAQYDYTFAGWALETDASAADSAAFDNVVADRRVYAAYSREIRSYPVNFVTAAADGGQTLQSDTLQYGATPAYTGSTPTSTKSDGGIYVFDSWSPSIATVTGPATYTAVFNDISVVVTYMVGNTQYDTERLASGSDAQGPQTNPTKAQTASTVYTFAGWNSASDATTPDSNAMLNVTENRTLYAVFSETARNYTISFVRASEDGGGTLESKQVAYGSTPSYTGNTPTSTKSDGGVYVFNGWSPAISAVTGDQTYTATFRDTRALVTYMVGNTQYATESVVLGQNASGPNSNPTKEQTVSTVYTFSGWNANSAATLPDENALVNVTADRTLYAIFTETARPYTITFVDDGGTTLEQKQVAYGTVPTYTGATPTKQGDYVFQSWSPALAAVTGDQTYTAVFIESTSPLVAYLKRSMTEYESGQNATKVASYAFYSMTTLTSVETYATTIEEYAFSGCANFEVIDLKAASGTVTINAAGLSSGKLNAIIIRSNSVATLSGSLPTGFSSGKCGIYVPSELVATYKVTSPWSTYASHIFAISEYPVTDWDTIKDSWSTIATKVANGTANYVVGDTKTVDLGTEGAIEMQIAAIDADELADGSGNTAKYTFVAKYLLNTNHRMNPANSNNTEGTGAIGGWGKSEMRTYLSTTIWALLPAELQAAIKEVKKYSCIYDTTGTKVSDDVTSDKLWIPSNREVLNSSTYETTGPTYTSIFSSSSYRIRYMPDTSSGVWWERSADSVNYFRYINTRGNDTGSYAYNTSGVLLCFCI